MTPQEQAAVRSVEHALQALRHALQESEVAGFGSLVLGPLSDAIQQADYALRTARGQT